MKFFDLFSGIGGFHLGMERAGHECVGACENDKYKNIVYKKRFPNTKVWGDARTVNPEELPDFEVLCAGFPCQAFSIAGKRRGFEDTRGTIFFEIARIAKEKRPRLLLLENVKGLLSHDKGKTYRTIRDTLDEMGYTVEWQLLNSKYFVPQNRERIIIIGHLRGTPKPEVFSFSEDYRETSEKSKEKRQQPNVNCIVANYWKGVDNHGERTMIYMAYPSANMKERIQIRCETWTITTLGNDFSIFDKGKLRMLTPLECERLQGFPDGWTEDVSDTQRYRSTGDAVTVDVVKYVGEMLA